MVLIDLTGKVGKSFRRMKNEVSELKRSVNEWILFLNSDQRDIKQRVYELERKVRQLELSEQKIFR